jgi:hypothetical protein
MVFAHDLLRWEMTELLRTGGPLKPGFGLSGAVVQLDRVFLQLFRVSCRRFQFDLQRLLAPGA